MSITYGNNYGASFKDATIIYEALQNISFDDDLKEKNRLSLIDYTKSKLMSVYPYQWDDYCHITPTPKKPDAIANEIEDTE